MKKSSFAKLVIGVILGLAFALGMCMWLLPEWNLFNLGIIITAVSGGLLLIWGIIEFFRHGLHRTSPNFKLIGKIAYCVVALLVLGGGMALILSLDMMLPGLILGGVGLVMALFAIPMFVGLK